MNKLVKNRILIISISLVLLVLINIAVSYSYYLGKVIGNETSTTLSFTSSGVIIEYENNSGSITDTNIIPGWSTTKTFKVKSTMKANEGNNNDSKLGYSVKMIVDSNDFPTNSIAYTLAQGSKTGNGETMEAATDVGIATGVNSAGILLGTGYFVVGDNEHNYTLTIKYMDSSTVDGNKNFGIHLVVETVKAVTVTVDVNGGTYTSSTTKYIPLGLAVEIETPTKEGYLFNGWVVTNGDGSTMGNKILANSLEITVQAQYILPPFAADSWATIAKAVSDRNTGVYAVGDTRKVSINGKDYTVRIANNSNYDCNLDSKTACGFVVEFVDSVAQKAMNSSNTNRRGWRATEMYKYLNGTYVASTKTWNRTGTLFSELPSDLQSVIIDTTVISGHGYNDSNSNRSDGNWESTDKLYLLSTGEIWSNCTGGKCSDTANGTTTTRQLDYYSNNQVSTSSTNRSYAIKYYDSLAAHWWLRASVSSVSQFFNTVSSNGSISNYSASVSSGSVAPAFRIG